MTETKKAGTAAGRVLRAGPVSGIMGGVSDMVSSILYDVSDFVGSIPATVTGRGGRKRCPYCAEVIKSEAVKCRYCNSDLEQDEKKGRE
jgi:hypothetical protein